MRQTETFSPNNHDVGGGGRASFSPNNNRSTSSTFFLGREEGACFPTRPPNTIKPTRPSREKIAASVKPMMKSVPVDRINALDEIVRLAGDKPELWKKPRFGEFEYWIALKCGWISNDDLREDTKAHEAKRRLALGSSHRFSSDRYSWTAQSRFEQEERRDYTPQINMKLVHDRNLTDSARRIALFVMRHAYQKNRSGRFIGMTVSFMMKGLSLSRRTVQRCLTLLETRGYFRCEVATNDQTKMCIGLIIRLLGPLFPDHHKDSWPEKRTNSGAPSLSLKQTEFKKTIEGAKHRVLRLTWALKCMVGVVRSAVKAGPLLTPSHVPQCRGFQTMGFFCPEFGASKEGGGGKHGSGQ